MRHSLLWPLALPKASTVFFAGIWKDHVEGWTLAPHDDYRIVPHSVEERCSSLETNLAPLRVGVGSLGRYLAHLMDDGNTVREHGGFRKGLFERHTPEHFHVYAKEGDPSEWSFF